MIEQLKTIRDGLENFTEPYLQKALTALSDLESHLAQYEAGDVASAAAQGFRDGVASVTQQEPVAWVECDGELVWNNREAAIGRNLYTAAPVAQQPAPGSTAEYEQWVKDGRPVAQQPKCVCGQPTSFGVVHRTDGPCFVYEAQQSQADSIPVAAFDRLMALCESQAQRIIELEDKQPQAEAVPQAAEFCWLVEHFDIANKSTGHYYTGKVGIGDRVLTTMDPHQAQRYDTWRDANNASAKLGSTLTGTWRAMQHGFHRMEPQQAEAVPFNHATQLQIAYVKGLGDGAMQAEAVPSDVVRDAERYRWLRDQNADLDAGFYVGDETDKLPEEITWVGSDLDAAIDAAIAQQKGGGA